MRFFVFRRIQKLQSFLNIFFSFYFFCVFPASVTELTEKCTISYEEVEFEEKIGKGHTTAGDVAIAIPNHDSKILVGAKIVDYDGAIANNAMVSTPVLIPNRSSWCVRIVNLSAAEVTAKGKIILTFLK